MPELPEVEAARRVTDRALRGKRIERVRTADDPIVLEDGRRAVTRALSGRRVVELGRRGKHFWLVLDRGPGSCSTSA